MIIHTLAIAEDEDDLREALEEYFTRAGFDVIAAADGPAFRAAVAGRRVHLAILDITMPGEDGLSLARWLKARGPVGLILATALGRPIDRVVGLDIGADDYVVKPYDLKELRARVGSVIRRLGDDLSAPATPPVPMPAVLRIGILRLDPAAQALVTQDGLSTPLSSADFAVLTLLAGKAGQVVPRATLARAADAGADDPSERAIDVRIARLRKKLATLDPGTGALLRTVRGEGYALDPGPAGVSPA